MIVQTVGMISERKFDIIGWFFKNISETMWLGSFQNESNKDWAFVNSFSAK